MARHHPKFGHAPINDWKIELAVRSSRRSRLLNSPSFDKIVSDICRTFSSLDHKRERHRTEHNYSRFIAVIELDPQLIDLFHNSVTGYRAQYFLSQSVGEVANRISCTEIGEAVVARLQGSFKRTCKPSWVAKSLAAPGVKLWIHQGVWLHHAKLSDRTLYVSRWRRNAAASDQPKAMKLGGWAALMPEFETRLTLKGGFVSSTKHQLGQHKADRSRVLKQFGFT